MSLRAANSVTPAQINTSTANGPPRLVGDPTGRYAIALGGTGIAYLYDAMADAFTVSNRPYTAATIQGYFGPLAAAPKGAYFLLNGFILNSSLAAIGGSDSPASTTPGALASHRNVAAVAPVDQSSFLRLTTAVKQTVASTVSGDGRSVLELVDIDRGSDVVLGALAENPASSVFGNSRVNLPPRQLAADSKGSAYAITLSGLTVTPIAAVSARPLTQSVTGTMQPGAFVSINGSNLATAGTASQIPPPTVLGGTCVTLSGVALPLLTTSAGQIVAQIPTTLSVRPLRSAGAFAGHRTAERLDDGHAAEPIGATMRIFFWAAIPGCSRLSREFRKHLQDPEGRPECQLPPEVAAPQHSLTTHHGLAFARLGQRGDLRLRSDHRRANPPTWCWTKPAAACTS